MSERDKLLHNVAVLRVLANAYHRGMISGAVYDALWEEFKR